MVLPDEIYFALRGIPQRSPFGQIDTLTQRLHFSFWVFVAKTTDPDSYRGRRHGEIRFSLKNKAEPLFSTSMQDELKWLHQTRTKVLHATYP
jgi:hypothetical protein